MKTSFFLSSLALLAVSVNASIFQRFLNWAETHSIDISDRFVQEHVYSNWIVNDKYIDEINGKNLTYQLGHNAYSGYSTDEFAEIMGFNGQRPNNLRGYVQPISDLSSLPASIDWRSKGVVNPIKDQGQCGSCWTFSTIQALESAVAIKTGVLNSLSEQELVDCDNRANGGSDHGCNGGLMDNAFNWISKNGGICSEAAYPYVSGTTKTAGSCQMKSCSNVANTGILRHVDMQTNSDRAMMTALAQQPVSVAIEADQKAFQLYSSGVFTGSCGTNLDHGVGLVGYGTMDGTDYYILRNSWGTSWGVSGYMYLGRGNDPATGKAYNNGAGQCGVLGEASYPVV